MQRCATKLVWIYGNLHYEDRIKRLGLMRLGRSRIRSDLIEAFKIINGYYDITLDSFLWSPYGIGQTIIFSCCGLFFLLLSFFPRLISATADWMSAILPHMVWPLCEFKLQV